MESLIVLATAWIILVSPEGRSVVTNTRIDNVEFASADDCDTAARKWMPQLTRSAAVGARSVTFGEQQPAPDGATATYTCVEIEKN